jgi:hypothetical protein
MQKLSQNCRAKPHKHQTSHNVNPLLAAHVALPQLLLLLLLQPLGLTEVIRLCRHACLRLLLSKVQG